MGKRKKADSDDEDGDFVFEDEAAFEDDDEHDNGGGDDDDDDDNDASYGEDEESPPPKKKAKKESTTTTKKAASSSTRKKAASSTTTTTKKSASNKKESSTASKSKSTTSKSASKKKDVSIKSEPEAREVVFDYLKKTNRPFSVVNLVDNLHGQVKKAMCQKCIDKLVKEKKVTLKENKKTKVYFMNQDLMPVMDKDELKQMDDQIKELTVERNELKNEVNALTSEKAKYAKSMSNDELAEAIRQLEEECERKQARLDKLKGGAQLAHPDDKKNAMVKLNLYLKHWKQRKSIFKDIVDKLSEAADQKPAQFLEELGLDTDESVGAPSMASLGKLE